MKDSAYWMALSHLPKWGSGKINNLIIKFYHENKLTISDFFGLSESGWKEDFELATHEIVDLNKAKSELASYSFLAESLQNQGIEVIPITSPEYSKTLKINLKATFSPPILYVKGNKKLLQEKSIAIVGSREASDISLKFTDNVSKLASKEFKVVVSGFAKGVDKQALDSALNYKGQSIIVLPQGISTFTSGFKTYYKQILEGDVLVLSTFHPKATWKAGLAMARNPIIYGLADEIYVAESSEKGGTWSGVMDGLRKKRKIFVRLPENNEKNANKLLIQKGAVPVNFHGEELLNTIQNDLNSESLKENTDTEDNLDVNKKVLELLENKPLSLKEIISALNIQDKPEKFKRILKKLENIEIKKKGNTNYYLLKKVQSEQPQQPGLF